MPEKGRIHWIVRKHALRLMVGITGTDLRQREEVFCV